MTWKTSTNTSKIVGLPEDKLKEKSWDDTEELVKGVVKEKLKVKWLLHRYWYISLHDLGYQSCNLSMEIIRETPYLNSI